MNVGCHKHIYLSMEYFLWGWTNNENVLMMDLRRTFSIGRYISCLKQTKILYT